MDRRFRFHNSWGLFGEDSGILQPKELPELCVHLTCIHQREQGGEKRPNPLRGIFTHSNAIHFSQRSTIRARKSDACAKIQRIENSPF